MRDVIDLARLKAMDPDEAAALLAARLSDPVGDHDGALLDEWLLLDDDHQRAWARARRGLAALDDGGDDELLAELRAAARNARPEPGRRWLPIGAAAAAAVVLSVMGGLYTYAPSGPAGAPVIAVQPAAPAHYATARGERRDVMLADGSKLMLDTDSAVDVAFTPGRRQLQLLRGRASFAVRHDAGRPFAVRADGHEVVALGTQFDVSIQPGLFRVVLLNGRVSVSDGAAGTPPAVLNAGQQFVQHDGQKPVVSPIDGNAAQGRQQGMANFRDEPLVNVVAELNRYTDDQLVVTDPSLATLRITGAFRTGDVVRFGHALGAIYQVRLVQSGPHRFEIVRIAKTPR